MRRFRAAYEVIYHDDYPRLSVDRFVKGLATMAAIDEQAILDSRAEPDDALRVASYRPVSGPSGRNPVIYVVEHDVEVDQEAVTPERVQRRLSEVLGIPQQERTAFDVISVSVDEGL